MSQEFHEQQPEHMPVPPSLLPGILQRLGLSEDTPPDSGVDLMASLKHPQWYVRANAVRRLSAFGAQVPLGLVLIALDDPHVSVRANAIQVLVNLPAEKLQQALQDNEWQVRESAILAAEQIGMPMPVAPLQAIASHDPDEAVREAAQRMLKQQYPELFARSTHTTPEPFTTPAMIFTRLMTYPKQVSVNDNTCSIRSMEGSLMQQTNFSKNPLPRVGDSPPRRFTGPLWRTVGVSLAVIVVAINIVGWLLITNARQTHTQTGGSVGTTTINTAIVQSTPTAKATSTTNVTGKTLYTYTSPPPTPADDMMSVGWSSDGKYLAVSGFDITLLDAKNGEKVSSFGAGNASTWISWSPDGQRLISSSQSATIWDIKTQRAIGGYMPTMQSARVSSSSGNPMAVLSGGNIIYASAWSPDGKQVASAVDGNAYGFNVQIWDAATGNHLQTLQIKANATSQDYISDVSWSADGKYLAVISANNGVSIWDTATWKQLRTRQGNGAISWAPKGNLIATTSDNGIIEVWDASTGQVQYSFRGQSASLGIMALAWSPDGKYIAQGGHDVRIWDIAARKLFYTYTGYGKIPDNFIVRSLAWSPDSTSIASLGTGMNVIAPHQDNPVGSVNVWTIG